jgi:hypothetical protein
MHCWVGCLKCYLKLHRLVSKFGAAVFTCEGLDVCTLRGNVLDDCVANTVKDHP